MYNKEHMSRDRLANLQVLQQLIYNPQCGWVINIGLESMISSNTKQTVSLQLLIREAVITG